VTKEELAAMEKDSDRCADELSDARVDVMVLSACVQLPSLPSIQIVEDMVGIPVVSAAVCTTYRMLKEMGLKAQVPSAGRLLSGDY
jgi:maleate isomerase